MSSCIRSLRRQVAKNKIRKQGIVQACKHSYMGSGHDKSVIQSWFAEHWKLYVPTSIKPQIVKEEQS